MISQRNWCSIDYYSNWWHEPGGGDFKMRSSKISCNSQFHPEHQAIYTLMIKENHTSNVFNHKDKPYIAKICFFHRVIWIITAEVNLLLFATSERSTKTFSKKNLHFEETEGSQNSCLISWSFPTALRILTGLHPWSSNIRIYRIWRQIIPDFYQNNII